MKKKITFEVDIELDNKHLELKVISMLRDNFNYKNYDTFNVKVEDIK